MQRLTGTGYAPSASSEKQTAITPRLWKADRSRPAIIYCPSHNNDVTQATAPNYIDQFLYRLVDAGYVVVSADMGGKVSWGNDASQARLLDAKAYAQSATVGAKLGPVGILAFSMGATVALNTWRNNPTLFACFGGICPAVDIADLHDRNVNSYAAEIEAALGGAAAYPGAVASHNPAANAASYNGKPMRLWYATDDTTVAPSTVTAFASVSGASTWAQTGGHDPRPTPADDVVSFFLSNLT